MKPSTAVRAIAIGAAALLPSDLDNSQRAAPDPTLPNIHLEPGDIYDTVPESDTGDALLLVSAQARAQIKDAWVECAHDDEGYAIPGSNGFGIKCFDDDGDGRVDRSWSAGYNAWF